MSEPASPAEESLVDEVRERGARGRDRRPSAPPSGPSLAHVRSLTHDRSAASSSPLASPRPARRPPHLLASAAAWGHARRRTRRSRWRRRRRSARAPARARVWRRNRSMSPSSRRWAPTARARSRARPVCRSARRKTALRGAVVRRRRKRGNERNADSVRTGQSRSARNHPVQTACGRERQPADGRRHPCHAARWSVRAPCLRVMTARQGRGMAWRHTHALRTPPLPRRRVTSLTRTCRRVESTMTTTSRQRPPRRSGLVEVPAVEAEAAAAVRRRCGGGGVGAAFVCVASSVAVGV